MRFEISSGGLKLVRGDTMNRNSVYFLTGAILLAGCRGDRPVFGINHRLSETNEDGGLGRAGNGDTNVSGSSTGSGGTSSTDGTDDEASRSDEELRSSCSEEGLVRCAPGGFAVEACSATGEWLVREQCTEQKGVCARGECVACAPGETACDGESLRRCSAEGTWVSETCPSDTVCLESLGACGLCTDGETQCQDATSVGTCTNGTFVPSDCPANQPFCVGGKCQSCNPQSSSSYCEDGAPVTCTDGDWEKLPECDGETPICNPLTGACAACTAGAAHCSSTGQLARCDDFGQWVPQKCPDEMPMCVGSGCVACDPNAAELRCRDNSVEGCNADGEWEIVEACSGESPVCLAQTASCGACDEGDRQCNDSGTGFVVCNAQGQFIESICPEGTPLCTGGECVECSETIGAQRKCVGNTPQICSSNDWIAQAACSGETPTCDADTGECVCEEGAYRCHGSAGSSLQQCRDSAWVEVEKCQGDVPVCDSIGGRCGCDIGASKCVPGTDDSVLQCQGGAWVEQVCSAQGPVCHDGECRECAPGSPAICREPEWNDGRWEGRIREWCSSEAQAQEEVCPFTCSGGACVDTREVPGKFTCNRDYNLVCSTGEICCAESTPKCVSAESECGRVNGGSAFGAPMVRCDDHSECVEGQVCCVQFVPSPGASFSSCRAPEDCADRDRYMNSFQGVVCGPNDPCAVGTCVPWSETGVSYCDER